MARHNDAPHACPRGAVRLIQRGVRATTTTHSEKVKEKKFSVGMAALTGGLIMNKSVERTVRAMMVRVGFWQPPEVNPAASITNRFFTSWLCWNWLSTDFFGSLPIRATPISWMP